MSFCFTERVLFPTMASLCVKGHQHWEAQPIMRQVLSQLPLTFCIFNSFHHTSTVSSIVITAAFEMLISYPVTNEFLSWSLLLLSFLWKCLLLRLKYFKPLNHDKFNSERFELIIYNNTYSCIWLLKVMSWFMANPRSWMGIWHLS